MPYPSSNALGLIAFMAVSPLLAQTAFDQNVGKFVKSNCATCHNEQLKTGGLALTKYSPNTTTKHG
jgi:hypothetical protein